MKLKEKHKIWLSKSWKVLWQGSIIAFITLVLFEIVYRNYWIDFYRSALTALNPEEDLALSEDQTILIFGDSFTADPNSWVNVLRDTLTEHNIINSALPGSSVFHQKLFFEDRVEEFDPDQIIIQLYVGNDLIDYNRPQSFSAISLSRNLYWWISDYFISLQYINYKLGQFGSSKGSFDPKELEGFSTEKYNDRVKNYLLASPSIVQESISPKDELKDEFEHLKEDLIELIQQVDIPVFVMVIPHCVQTNDDQLEHYKKLGALLNEKEVTAFTFYDELNKLESELDQLTVWSPLGEFKLSQNNLYFENDPHLTPEGQSFLGKSTLVQLAKD